MKAQDYNKKLLKIYIYLNKQERESVRRLLMRKKKKYIQKKKNIKYKTIKKDEKKG